MPSQPKKTLSQKLINGIHRFIELIKRICRSIVNLYNRIKNYIKESFVAINTIEYSAVLLKRPPLLKPIAPDNVERQAMILEPYNNMCQTKKTIKKGERIPSVLIQNAKEWAVTDVLVKTNNDDEWKKYASKWGDSITYSYNVMNYAANITNTAYDFLRKIEICFATKDGQQAYGKIKNGKAVVSIEQKRQGFKKFDSIQDGDVLFEKMRFKLNKDK